MITQVSEWQTHTLIDLIDESEKTFFIRELITDMSVNDPCFCGSGKKQNKCHPDIHEKSIIANLMSVYEQLDQDTKERQQFSICKKGCAQCCSDYFQVSVVEFFMILQGLHTNGNNALLLKYIKTAQTRIQGIYLPEYDFANVPNFPECIFVDDLTNECKIYQLRPIICRLYGTVSELTKCEKISMSQQAIENLIPLNKEIDISNNIDLITDNKNNVYEFKPHALVYWFSRMTEEGAFKSKRMNDMFEVSTKFSSKEFLRIFLL